MSDGLVYARLPQSAKRDVASLRDEKRVEYAESAGALWLRFHPRRLPPEQRDRLRHRILGLPGAVLFEAGADLPALRRSGERLNTAQLPELQWEAVPTALPLAPPRPAVPPPAPSRVSPRLERLPSDAAPEPAGGLLVGWAALRDWALAATTPAFRLDPLRFALGTRNAERVALVLGTPLPPLSGTALRVASGVVHPLGFGFSPPVPHELLADALQAAPGDLLWFDTGAPLPVRIASEHVVPLSRQAVRATQHASEAPS